MLGRPKSTPIGGRFGSNIIVVMLEGATIVRDGQIPPETAVAATRYEVSAVG